MTEHENYLNAEREVLHELARGEISVNECIRRSYILKLKYNQHCEECSRAYWEVINFHEKSSENMEDRRWSASLNW